MANKVCVITGGAGSIGLECAKLFLQEGAQVMLVDLQEEKLRQAAASLGTEKVAYCAADVSQSADVQTYFQKTVERFGPIDVIVSNAGNSGVIAPVTVYPEEVFDSVYAVHVKGAFLACKYGLPLMNDGGSIIIVSSVAAFRGDPGVCAYIAAKQAQIGLMRSVAKEAAERSIRVNTIHPGPVDNQFQLNIEKELGQILKTDGTAFFNQLIPLRRHAHPQEIARSILYLATDQSSFTTGATLVVDGGMSMA